MARNALLLLCRDVRSVAGGAFLRSRLVEEDGFAFHGTRQLVASFAANVLVCALQREIGPLVMVKQRGLPLCAVVALGAGCEFALSELPAVDILVTLLTF